MIMPRRGGGDGHQRTTRMPPPFNIIISRITVGCLLINLVMYSLNVAATRLRFILFYISCLFRCLRQRGRVWGAGQCEFFTFLFSWTWDNAMWTHHIVPFLPLVSLLMGANLNVLQIMSLDDDDDASAVVNQCSGWGDTEVIRKNRKCPWILDRSQDVTRARWEGWGTSKSHPCVNPA